MDRSGKLFVRQIDGFSVSVISHDPSKARPCRKFLRPGITGHDENNRGMGEEVIAVLEEEFQRWSPGCNDHIDSAVSILLPQISM
jgi:hypothetical protein